MNKLSVFSVCTLFLLSLALAIPKQVHAQSQQVMLAGYKHKPPVRTSGSGTAKVTLKGDTLVVEGDFENLTSQFSGAYLMVSLRGEAGNQLYRLNVQLNGDKTGGTLSAKENRFKLTEGEKELLKKGEIYINITSFDHDTGELRGDIAPMG